MLTTTKPIPIEVIQQIKVHLQYKPRELAWFVVMTNTGIRVGDLLKMTRSNVRWNDGLAEFFWKEEKTGKLRTVPLNAYASQVLHRWMMVHPGKTQLIFEGERGKMNSPYFAQMLKGWCKAVGYEEERTATHSCRKSFVKTHYDRGTKLAVLMTMLNHSTETQTLRYVGILDTEIQKVYADAI